MSNSNRKATRPVRSAGHEDAARSTPTGYDPPEFASGPARAKWEELGQPSLQGLEPSGQTGFTVADVEAAAEEEG